MSHSLRSKIKCLRYKGIITDKDCDRLRKALDNEDVLDKIRAEIIDEKDAAYADFDQYKVDYLGVDAEYVEDELPQDDFRYGMERAIEIINKYIAEGKPQENETWNGIHAQITAPKGTFDRIWNEAEEVDDNDI